MTVEGCKLGGKRGGAVLRKRAEEAYYADPNICEFCGEIIPLKEGIPVSSTRQNRFCDKSCAAKFNGKMFPKRKPKKTFTHCERCGEVVNFTKLSTGGYQRRRFCNACVRLARIESRGGIPIETLTKGEVRSKYPSYMWFGNEINSHARWVFKSSGKKAVCKVCGYSLHVEVCHIKDIKDFTDDALVSEINCIDNLAALCRNCHWESDHGFLEID